MAIFRCTSCNQIFDLAFLFDLDGIVFCGSCYSEYKDRLKPKKPKHPMDDYDPFLPEPPPKVTPKKEKRVHK